ncbi:hypothetical protein FJV46_10695 [Arthrobacter agilis]|uniref:phage tail tube protein n=1 Tax=Arthrobacter agilis TaxID=37921 RepID=UPI000B34E36A|nr:hypothetical protein [Arthrobacter agilis]OUM44156.1 hypothetical protein B8W74_04590 [Arthrobacter agilis]PPB46532.1 hypothetical protein CI784_06885 [Arthrobacter agilis]TPV23812.1 hypothetical protein FJV46_10695 [Arthrobacter agilis]VDR32546.1 Uncharacterised protein [Arthrobacter agilis]
MAEIPSTPADGNVLAVLLPAVTDIDAITLAEATATSAVDISCYLTSDGYTPSLDEQVITDDRLCSRETYEQPGRSQRGLSLTYIDNTNAPNEATDNEAKDALVPGSEHVLLVRRGIPFETPLASDQTYTAFRIKPGQYMEMPPEANSVLKITQKQFITGRSGVSKKIAAAA